MDKAHSKHAADHEFEEIVPAAESLAGRLGIDDLDKVKLIITADLGTCSMLVRDVLELRRGSVIQLNKLAGEMTDVHVNGLPLARGEVVVIGDTLHVRIGEIVGQEQSEDMLLEGESEDE